MPRPQNILDAIAACMSVADHDDVLEVRKRWFEGAHGRSATEEVVIVTTDGAVYRLHAIRVPTDVIDVVLKDSHAL